MSAMPLHLIACVSTKLDKSARADDLYVSPWFAKAKAYVTGLRAPWRILSAKHGLLDPSAVIAPYELTLNTMPVAERRVWAERVLAVLRELACDGDDVVVLAGDRYRQFLIPGLKSRGVRVHVPMQGLGLGEQLRWLTQARKRAR
jgi:hypothetical protein